MRHFVRTAAQRTGSRIRPRTFCTKHGRVIGLRPMTGHLGMTTTRRNVLVVGPSWIGDMVMAQSLFQTLCQQISDVQLSVLAPSWSLPLLGRMQEVAAAIPTPFEHGRLSLRHRFQLAHQLRAKHLRSSDHPYPDRSKRPWCHFSPEFRCAPDFWARSVTAY